MPKAKEAKETATELEFLQWFYANCDFGPADGDVRHFLRDQFVEETGKAVPKAYADEE